LTDSENRGADPKRHPRRIRIRLTRNLVLYYRQSARSADKGEHRREGYAKKIYQRTKNEAWTKPIETFGVIVVFLYTVFAGYQSCQMRSANKLMRAANQNATRALHVSERAYITTDGPVLDPTTKFVTMGLINDGHIPCPHSETVAHEATVNMPVLNVAPDIKDAVEFHWKSNRGPISPGRNLVTLAIPTAFSESKFTPQGAFQAILIAGTVTYEDGFADDGPQQWAFCFQSVYHLTLKKIFWVACDPTIVLPQMEKLDGYPNNEQQN